MSAASRAAFAHQERIEAAKAFAEENASLTLAAPGLLLAAKAVLDGGFEREDTEYADALFACLEQAIAQAESRS